MRRSNAPTLHTVAEEAGVTAMMASVVLNGARSSTRVSDATRARILEAAARLGYRRNAAALGLSRRTMSTIGVTAVVDGSEINYYFLEVLNGILEAAARHGQNTTVFSIAGWEKDEAHVLDCCDGRIDGMILIGPQLSENFALAFDAHTPFVTIHANRALSGVPHIGIDDEGGAYNMTRYLLALGHQRLLHITGGTHSGAVARTLGYRRAVEEAGLPAESARVAEGDFNIFTGRHAAQELLRQRDTMPLPSAIFCASDAIAFGCIETLQSAGVRVPEDVSIAGFDDVPLARMTRPLLTTMQQPFRRMGQRAVELLLPSPASVGDGKFDPPDSTVKQIFKAELIARESTIPAVRPFF